MPEVEWKMIAITLMNAKPGHTTATIKVTITLNVWTMMAVLIVIAKSKGNLKKQVLKELLKHMLLICASFCLVWVGPTYQVPHAGLRVRFAS